MAFSIQQVWQVVASHLKSPVRLETNRIQQITVSEDGAAHEQQNKVFFVRLAKGDVSTMRLLLGMTPKKKRRGQHGQHDCDRGHQKVAGPKA